MTQDALAQNSSKIHIVVPRRTFLFNINNVKRSSNRVADTHKSTTTLNQDDNRIELTLLEFCDTTRCVTVT